MSVFCLMVLAAAIQLVFCEHLWQRETNGTDDLALSQVLETPFPYYFPEHNDTARLFPMEPCNGITLEEATIDQLQDYMSNGKLTTSQLVMCYLQRQYQTDGYVEYVLTHFCVHISCET